MAACNRSVHIHESPTTQLDQGRTASAFSPGCYGGVCHRGTDAVRLRHPASRRRRPGGGKAGQCLQVPPSLPTELRRVALLPVAYDSEATDLADGCRILQPVVSEQLIDTKRFEVVSVDPALLRERTGQSAWTGKEVLPNGFLETMRTWSGCDAVMFCELTAYRAYSPVCIGWRMKLVDTRTQRILSAADRFLTPASVRSRRASGTTFPMCCQIPAKRSRIGNCGRLPASGGPSAAQVLATLPAR